MYSKIFLKQYLYCSFFISKVKDSGSDNHKKENKTFIYKTKSNFAFAINFHSFHLKDNLVMKNNLKNALISKKTEFSLDSDKRKQRPAESILYASTITTCPDSSGTKSVLINEHNVYKENIVNTNNSSFRIKKADKNIHVSDDVFDHESIISYFK